MAELNSTTRTRASSGAAVGTTRSAEVAAERNGYLVPILRRRIPERVVEVGFLGALGASTVFGAVDLPLAALIGVGVLIARHRARG